MKRIKLGLLPRIIIAIALGIVCGLFFPDWLTAIFVTINSLFGNFLGFIIPLLILGLVAPGIADLGKGAGKLLLITALLAYCFTLFSGFFTYFSCSLAYPWLLDTTQQLTPLEGEAVKTIAPYFTIDMPPLMQVMTSLILAFTLGLGMSVIPGNRLKNVMEDFKDIINIVISSIIIPLLPLYIFGIFLNMTTSGQVAGIMGVFVKIIIVIFVMTVILALPAILHRRIGRKNQSFPFVPEHVAGIHDGFGYTIFRSNDSRYLGANHQKRSTSRISRFCHSPVCHIHLSG